METWVRVSTKIGNGCGKIELDYGDKRMGSIWIGMIENNL
jgi:hypothetical protein